MTKLISPETFNNMVRDLYHKGKSNADITKALRCQPYKVEHAIGFITSYNEHAYCYAYKIIRDPEPVLKSFNQYTAISEQED